ncbi:MAG: MerR family transcriptional regulator [Nocardioides sp.]
MGLFTIGEFARRSHLTPKALRLYDEMGLLSPVEVDEVTGYRRYAEHQLARARLVARLRLAGMPLARIQVVADLPDRAAAAELTSYWRQVEADTATAGALVSALVEELTAQEHTMTTAHPPALTHAVRTGIGGRDAQLDATRVDGDVFAVADGFGGASGVADAAVGALGSPRTIAELDEAVRRAADAVVSSAEGHADAGTTLTAMVIEDGQALIGHLGDSRAHLVREGRLERLTRDHTVVQTLIDEGRLSPEEARSDDRRVQLNRALAADAPPHPDLSVRVTRPRDRFVLTTDGVHGVLEPAELTALLVSSDSPDEVVAAVDAAVRSAGAPDNWAVLVVDLGG